MLLKTLVIALMVAILASLGTALYFLIVDHGKNKRTAIALTVRIILSLSLFGLLIIAFYTGHIHPHGIISGQ